MRLSKTSVCVTALAAALGWSAVAAAQGAGAIVFGDNTSLWANDGECDDPRFRGDGAANTLLDADRGRDAADCKAALDAGTITFLAEDAPELVPTSGFDLGGGEEWTGEDVDLSSLFSGEYDGVNFGDNSGSWINDGECDDPRFEGADGAMGMTQRNNAGTDAHDCHAQYLAGAITFKGELPPMFQGAADGVDYGNNDSVFAGDGECDDPRFSGEGVAGSPSRDNVRMDADDCRSAVLAGQASFDGELPPPFEGVFNGVDYGDNSADFAFDSECDDPRFEGENVSEYAGRANANRDADDCKRAVEAGTATYKGELEPLFEGVFRDIDFGANTGAYTEDGECDDSRFRGPGMANPPFQAENVLGDAHDCKAAFEKGFIRFVAAEPLFTGVFNGVDFGINVGPYVNDGQCDDTRFEGPGASGLDDATWNKKDAFDCQLLFSEGAVISKAE